MTRDIQNFFWGYATIVAVVCIIAGGLNLCSERQNRLKEVCIQAGGSILVAGETFHCVRGMAPAGGGQRAP